MRLAIKLCLFFFVFTLSKLSAQINIIDQPVYLSKQVGTVQELLDNVESKNDLVFAFDPNKIFVRRIVRLRNKKYILKNLLNQLFIGQDIQYKSKNNKVFLLPLILEYIEMSGYIYSEETREILPSALIVDELSEQSVYADDQGFYHMKFLKGMVDCSVYYLGNIQIRKRLELQRNSNVDFYLATDYNLDSVVIRTKKYDPYSIATGTGEKLINYFRNCFKGKLGQKELFEQVRMFAGVQSGNEAEGGFYVRGGTPDQNLILMDGISLYETSHIGGMSSIFIDDMVRDVVFIKDGFSAKYGGRLSSVLDVKLKDGNWKKTNTIFDIGFDALHFHMDGPLIDNHLSFNFSLRKSILNRTVSPLLAKLRSYDNLDLKYFDANFKLTYKINKNHKLSITSYMGNDNVGIYRDTNNVKSKLIDRSKLGWGTSLIGLNYQYKISKKLFLQFHSHFLQYNKYSYGNFHFFTDAVGEVSDLDVSVESKIIDRNFKIDLNYELNKYNKLRFGISNTNHRYKPKISKSQKLYGEKDWIEISNSDSSFQTNEYFVYIEDQMSIGDAFELDIGLQWGNYRIKNKKYGSLQPRVSLKWHPFKMLSITSSYSRMVQNTHYLVNPGLGLPSELWIPATEKIAPQEVDQYDIGASFYTDDLWRVGVGYHYKKYNNVLEFDDPNDLLYAYIINNTSVTNDNLDWQENVEVGEAWINSWEFYLFKKWKNFDWWMSYTWSKHVRLFGGLNDGKMFLDKNDRTHDINLKAKFNISSKWNGVATWTYGTGKMYTLSFEEVPLFKEFGTIVVEAERNNWRTDPYHHLDLSAQYKKVFSKFIFTSNFGVYNVYNRLNPLYYYYYIDGKTKKHKLSKISLYPILPFINLRFKF